MAETFPTGVVPSAKPPRGTKSGLHSLPVPTKRMIA